MQPIVLRMDKRRVSLMRRIAVSMAPPTEALSVWENGRGREISRTAKCPRSATRYNSS